jgi:hypothetical protein
MRCEDAQRIEPGGAIVLEEDAELAILEPGGGGFSRHIRRAVERTDGIARVGGENPDTQFCEIDRPLRPIRGPPPGYQRKLLGQFGRF